MAGASNLQASLKVGDSGQPQEGGQALRGYVPWSPQASTRVVLKQVEEILEEYSEHLPLTIRQIFYRLVGAYGYPKSENAYNRIINYMGRARRARLIPMAVIRDDGTVTITDRFYEGIEDFEDETARRARAFRLNRQVGQPQHMELWCEAAGMLHQLSRVARHFSVEPYSGSGFDSITAKYEISRRAMEREVPTLILHLGDFDPDGVNLFRSTVEDAAAFVEADRKIQTQAVEYRRVGLNPDQIEHFELPTGSLKKAKNKARETINARWRARHGEVTCQLEALAPDQLATTVENTILGLLDSDTYNRQVALESGERAELLGLPSGEVA